MTRKNLLVYFVLFFLNSNLACAEIKINEFVSDPDSGSEWIELLNTSSFAVDLSGWAWTELASPGGDGEHESSPKNLSGIIPAGGIFVFEMNSALNNTGDSIGLYDNASFVDRVTFGNVNNFPVDLGAPAKGNSGAYINGYWLTNQEPSKGEQNPDSASSGEDSTSDADDTSSVSKNSAKSETKTAAIQKIKVKIIGNSLAYIGIPFSLEGEVFGTKGEAIHSGRYYWNFGDGDSREDMVLDADSFEHTYFYPGDYSVVLEHYPNFFADVPDATEKLVIKVIVPKVSISSVGDEKDFFVELFNNSNYAVDLSNWFLLSGQKSFLIPHGTMLEANRKMIIPSQISHFSFEDKNNLKLINSEGSMIFDYLLSMTSKHKANKDSVPNTIEQIYKSGSISGDELSASAVGASVFSKEGDSSLSSVIPIASFLFIGASAGAVYFIRRKKVIAETGDDFEILDE